MKKFLASIAIVAFASVLHAADAPRTTGFAFDDHPGQHLDVLLDGKLVGRYINGHDISTPERRLETFKPYLTVFDADGKEPITNGFNPKGPFPHHRGIFIGYRMITFNGKQYDRWHMHDANGPVNPKTNKKSDIPGEIVHQKFEDQKAGPDSASFTSVTSWDDEAGKPMIVERRTMSFHRAPAPARLIIDFTSKLTPSMDTVFDGDPEHAGVQYRPSNDVDGARTLYVIPAEHPNAHKDLDYPWVGETYTLKNGKTYSVVDISHPENPKGAHWSAYRNYGRFGAFIKQEVKSGESLTLKYRFLISDGDMPAIDVIDKVINDYTGGKTQTGKVTIMPAEGQAAQKPKTQPTTK